MDCNGTCNAASLRSVPVQAMQMPGKPNHLYRTGVLTCFRVSPVF